jgi:serine protease AprX
MAAILSVGLVSAKNHNKLAPDLKNGNPGAVTDIIVQFKDEPGEKHHKKLKSKGGSLKLEMKHVRAGLYSIPAAALDELSDDPDVLYISPDRPLSGTLEFATPTVQAPIARSYGWDGRGIGIAILDSGISDDNDLKDPVTGVNRIVYKQGFYPGNKVVDTYGHGTPVAGAAAGSGASSAGKYTGVAPRANLINLRVLSDDGAGQDSYVIAAIDRAIQLKNTYNIRVINLSLGRPVFES